ncbi:MAG: hypothetical protein ACYDDO_11915 [Acidiferrobacterales bacterium]
MDEVSANTGGRNPEINDVGGSRQYALHELCHWKMQALKEERLKPHFHLAPDPWKWNSLLQHND